MAVALLALSGCPSVDLGDTPPDIGLCNPVRGQPYFDSDIWPTYLNSPDPTKQCTQSGCHDQNGKSSLRFMTDPVDLEANYKAAQIELDCDVPDASLLRPSRSPASSRTRAATSSRAKPIRRSWIS